MIGPVKSGWGKSQNAQKRISLVNRRSLKMDDAVRPHGYKGVKPSDDKLPPPWDSVPHESQPINGAAVNPPPLTELCVSTPIRSSDGPCASGEMMRLPLPSNPMKPRSNRWSMLGVSSSPFSPFSRSSLVLQSRHALQWLTIGS